MNIQLTEKAKAHFAKKLYPGAFVVLGTETSGCSGLSYVTEIREGEISEGLEKLDEALPIYVDRKSLAALQGMIVDYQTQGLASKLVYINPNETARCGCGESFSTQ